MEYLFDEKEKGIIQKLKNSEPLRIWTEYVKVIFEFNDSYVELECVSKRASTQNNDDQAIIAEIREFGEKYIPLKNSKALVENDKINDIKLVRTLLYFTDSISEPEKVKKMDSKMNKILSKIAGIRKSEIEKLFHGTSSSYYSEVICKPNSAESKNVKKEHSNLIDVGLLLEIGNQYLPAFVQKNGYGFAHLERKPLLTLKEVTSELTDYELN